MFVFEGCDVAETCLFAHYRTSMRFKISKTVKAANGLGPMTADLATRVGLHAYAKFDRGGKADGFACVKTGPSSVRAGWMTASGEWLDTTPHDPTTNSSRAEYHFAPDKWYTFAIALSPSMNVQCTITTHTKDVHEEGTDKVVLTTGVRVGHNIKGTFGVSAESNNIVFGSIGACPLAFTSFNSLSNSMSKIKAVHDGRVAKLVRIKELATSSVFLALIVFVVVVSGWATGVTAGACSWVCWPRLIFLNVTWNLITNDLRLQPHTIAQAHPHPNYDARRRFS